MKIFETSTRPDPLKGYLTSLEVTTFNGNPIVYNRGEKIKVSVVDNGRHIGYVGNGRIVSNLSEAKLINGSFNYHIDKDRSNFSFKRVA